MQEEKDDLVSRVESKFLGSSKATKKPSRLREIFDGTVGKAKNKVFDFIGNHKKLATYAAAGTISATILAGSLFYIMGMDFLTKRQNYPERNVLYRSSNVTYIAGNPEKRAAARSDQESDTKYYEGGIETKVGSILLETVRELRGDIRYFNMYNDQKRRIGNSTQKPERFQAGIRLGGSLNYKEEFAIVKNPELRTSESYIVYKFSPERAFRERDIDVLEYSPERGILEDDLGIVDATGNVKIMKNRLVESRNMLGWLLGKEFRAGTMLQEYAKTPENKELAKKFLEMIRYMDTARSERQIEREKLARDVLELESKMERITVYSTFEDGFFKILPQESTVYLGHDPSFLERSKHWAGIGRNDDIRLRVENHWDLWPGDYPLLRNIGFGSGENKTFPFAKCNNGNYTIVDKFGDLAKIEIKDFILFYGQDVIYSYYLDLNGNGKIEKADELLGRVLCKTTHDEMEQIDKLAKGEQPEADLTLTINYSFMMPDDNITRGKEYFRLCAYMESFMPDQVHRGFGKHSLLGYINDQRSDLMLADDLCLENLSRALTQESTLVAQYDIVKLLIAARRPYAEELAKTYGIEDEFAGKYNPSTALSERTIIGPLPAIALLLGGAGFWYMKRRRNQNLAQGGK